MPKPLKSEENNMNDDKAVAVLPKQEVGALYESQSVEYASRQLAQLQAFVNANMKQGRDYGIIPGCKKPSLWKPGAEKLLNFNGLSVILDPVTAQTILDFKTNFLSYTYRASVINPRTNAVLATCEGNCNSAEKKYAYEKDARTIMNTLMKMAQKRALVGAALIACRASENFTDAEEPGDTVDKSDEAAHEQEQPNGSIISEAQGKRLYAIWKGAGKSDADVKAHLKDKYGLDSTKQIKRSDYEAIVAFAQSK